MARQSGVVHEKSGNCGIAAYTSVCVRENCWNRVMSSPPKELPEKPLSLPARRRAARLEAALRENLKKRKDQSRSRRALGEDQGDAPEE
jgi:hypothetical protein